MDKIYRRQTQLSGTPKKKKNEKNRKRNVIINFRVSPQEKELIDARIKMTGIARGEFFIESCLYQAILVRGNAKTFFEIEKKIQELSKLLKTEASLENLEIAQAECLKTILEILDSFSKKCL